MKIKRRKFSISLSALSILSITAASVVAVSVCIAIFSTVCSNALIKDAKLSSEQAVGQVALAVNNNLDSMRQKLEFIEETVADCSDSEDFYNKISVITRMQRDIYAVTVYRVVSSASQRLEVSELFTTNPIFARITSHASESVMKNELITFCRQARKLISRSQKRETEVICDRALQIIDEQYSDENLSLTAVSNELCVSPNYLSALIKKHKKKNFVTLLTERRMKAAHEMLICTNMKVLEISERCGYSDQHYFSYCFKRFYGDSPNKVRSVNRSEE